MKNESNIKRVISSIQGMHCASCAITIESQLQKAHGVEVAEVNYASEKVKLAFDSKKTNLQEIGKTINDLGYKLVIPQEELSLKTSNTKDLFTQGRLQKQKDLQKQRDSALLVLPLAIIVFVIMMWEIAPSIINNFPNFLIPKDLFSRILFILASIILIIAGKPFLKGIVTFVQRGIASMETLVGIGTFTAYIYSSFIVLFPDIVEGIGLSHTTFFDVTIVIIGFVVFGKYLEAKSKFRTGEAIAKLIDIQVKTALVERNGNELEIKIENLVVGDIVIIKPGSKIPVDGTIIKGSSSIDESMITGEAIPVDKKEGDSVVGGTINKHGAFTFKATKVGADTLLANIIKLVEEAQNSKAPIQSLADNVSKIFVPIVLVLSVITILSWLIIGSRFMDFDKALTLGLLCFVGVLVIACPCALGLATPTAIIVGIGKSAQNGILIKNAEGLEQLCKVNTIVMDKTGTITKGKPEVTDIFTTNNIFKDVGEKEILQILASLEKNSEHPLSVAVKEKAQKENVKTLDVENFEVLEGRGITGIIKGKKYYVGNEILMKNNAISYNESIVQKFSKEGKTPVILSDETKYIAIIAISDNLKENSKKVVEKLNKIGINTVMLTGDNSDTANYIAKEVGIQKVFAQVLPAQKAEIIKQLQQNGNIVAMAGDGINDALALMQADVGIAMSTGTDIAIESADIILLKGDISKIYTAIRLSKRTLATIKQNIFWAFIYNIIGIPIAMGVLYPFWGITLNPVFAGLAMAFSSVSVVLNSLRINWGNDVVKL